MILRGISKTGIEVTSQIGSLQNRLTRCQSIANAAVRNRFSRRDIIKKWDAIFRKVRRDADLNRKRPRVPVDYQYRLVLFLDFLGFKDLVERSESDSKVLNDLLETIDVIRDIGGGREGTPSEQLTQFSDSLVVSYSIEEKSAVFYLLNNIALRIRTRRAKSDMPSDIAKVANVALSLSMRRWHLRFEHAVTLRAQLEKYLANGSK